MRFAGSVAVLVTVGLAAFSTVAQSTNEVELLRKQLQQLQEDFKKVQEQQRQQIETLQKQIEALRQQASSPPTNVPPPTSAPSAEVPLAVPTPAPSSAEVSPEPGTAWSPSAPITLFGGQRNYLNLSFDALVAAGTSTANDIQKLQLGGHDPRERGFTVQNLETVLEGKVDPYFRGQGNLVFQIDPHGDTTVEAEEAYLETMSLPANLQVKAGQFFDEFGRLNATHPHTWDFVDQPLVNGRFFGEDGLRSAGARLSWLAPTPFYSELFFTIANSQGGTAYSFRNDHGGALFMGRPAIDRGVKTLGDMLYVPRYAASFNLTDSQTIVAGTSAAFGPNSSGTDTDTQIYGVDLFWKWKSPHQNAGFPFVTWQTEAMMRRFEAGAYPGDVNLPALPRETVVDYGVYSQVSYGFHKGWVAGFRVDYVFPEEQADYEKILGPDPDRATRWRLSPDLTWYPTEFSKLRLQYNFDHRDLIGDDHSVWVQFEFLLGSHAAHKF
jgi:hypothetical protein